MVVNPLWRWPGNIHGKFYRQGLATALTSNHPAVSGVRGMSIWFPQQACCRWSLVTNWGEVARRFFRAFWALGAMPRQQQNHQLVLAVAFSREGLRRLHKWNRLRPEKSIPQAWRSCWSPAFGLPFNAFKAALAKGRGNRKCTFRLNGGTLWR